MRVADVWANWWDRSLFAAYQPLDALYERFGLQARRSMTRDSLIAEADIGDVERIVVSATAFPGSPSDNAAVARVVATAPDRLVGCASVDPRLGMPAVRELRRAVREDGMRALKLLPFLYDRPPNDAIYYPLYAACIDLGIPALILTGHTAVAARSEYGRPLYLDDVALHFPELEIIAGHAGYPWTEEMIAIAWKHANVHIDTSGHRPKYFPPTLRHFMNSYGREKVMFGTGYPLMDYAGPLGEVDGLQLKPEARAAFLWGNAARVWGWT